MQSLTTAVKMVGRSVDKKDEIRAYIKACSKLGCSLKKLMTEISTAFGPSCVSYDTVRRWKKKFESGVESMKNAPKSGRPKSASHKEIVSRKESEETEEIKNSPSTLTHYKDSRPCPTVSQYQLDAPVM